ncbi:EspA/EspE family type VII secretion system effector [Mycolicibacterium fortuitum]|uniref:EspA/EspE family type VII secretion system effector n=1 Tax=Mycolicibacterium fortuitum TaxID=1766 RepID=UPI001CE099B2|nr:EspA/EspE family type VII secretion system effector [Mycolicibacterium fortuitum]MCA4726488.1 hypothetical protein [Mycolicibacterium fortuitum]
MGLSGDMADFGKDFIENNQNWTERAARVGEFGNQMVDLSQKAADFFASAPGPRPVRTAHSPILVAGQQTIESMRHSTGVGDPDNGQRFGDAADQVVAAGQMLASAFPDDSWDSSGASAYAGRNSEQVGRVQTMLGLDHMVAGVLATEAGQIAATRDSLDGHADWLGAMSMLTTGAGAVPGFGTAARLATEFAMVAKAVGDSNDDVTTLSARIDQNAAVLQTAAAQYEALAADVTPAEPQAAEPQAPADADSTAAGCPTAGDEVAPGGGGEVPSGGAGSAPAGWSAATPMSSAPASPAGMPGAVSPSPDAATGAAGALGGILGSLVSPLSGLLAGFAQAAGQAAQIVTQAATQAAQLAGQAGDPVEDTAELDSDRDRDDEGDADEDEDERDSHDEDRKKDGEGEPEEGRAGGVPGTDSAGAPADPQAPDARNEPAKTLPPDLEAVASGGAEAGSAPVHVGADFEQGQLHVAAAATLDRGVPGSAAVIDR